MTQASASGKIILFGEHAVVYGQPALAVPVTQVRATVSVRAAARQGCRLLAPDVNLSADLNSLSDEHPLAAAVRYTLKALDAEPPQALIEICSEIPVAAGLGSGAAVTVALVRALSAYLGRRLPDDTVNALAYEVEKIHHGQPSGIDNTVVTYERPVFFQRGADGARIETLHIGAPFWLVIGDTGIAAPTREAVADVRRLWEREPARYETVFNAIGDLVRAARRALEAGRTEELGALMDENQVLLRALTVSSPELDALISAAKDAGAWGAKLSGGGRGGNMIALVPQADAERVAQALQRAGACRTLITQVGEN